ncbi:MAG: long-chain-fatty-acid--CoA ligase [Phreatobacter sp.]
MYLTQALHRSLQVSSDDVMTICGDRIRTVRQVADRVARLAGGLSALGISDGDRVAMLALNSDRYHEYLLAVPWANAVLNPVNTRWSVAEITYSLVDSQTKILIIDDAFLPMLDALRVGYPALRAVIHCGDGPPPEGCLSYEGLIAAALPMDDARRGDDEIAGIFYTGGTTGFPKGVTLSHRNLLVQYYGVLASRYFLRPGGRFLHAAPMFHLADLAGWGAQLIFGGAHVFIPSFDPAAVLTAIQNKKVTDTILVPTMVRLVLDHPEFGNYDVTSLKAVVCGGSPLSRALLNDANKAFPSASFMQGYGMTEVAAVATILGPAEYEAFPDVMMSAGRAMPHNEVRIVDEEQNELPRGTVGEIVVRGGNVMLGYWNQPDATASAVRNGWMHTGDGGYMDERGFVFIVDRIKDMIVTGGENVYSAEVENAVVAHPGVAACAVIGVPDPDWGERVHAMIVPKSGFELDARQIREHAKTLIAGYKAPRSVEFVGALPVSGTGKVLKHQLRKKYWADADRQVN